MGSTDSAPFEATADGLRVRLRVQPGASREAVAGRVALSDGRSVLAVRVCAPAHGGKANAALVALLAKTWKLPKSAITIVAGHAQRQKTVLISGNAETLQTKLIGWLARQA